MSKENKIKEQDVIQNTKSGPRTVASIMNDLQHLGIEPGMVLLVHSSLSSIGWVSGGAVAVIQALERILGPEGTLVMPTHSGDLTDPEKWENPPVPDDWKDIIRHTMPAFEPDLTPTRGVGRIPEIFRKKRGVLRSCHPHDSFAASGKEARFITESHQIDFGLGEGSPLGRIYDLAGWILLLGVGFESNTSLHLAEHRADFPSKKVIQQDGPILQKGKRNWIKIKSLGEYVDDFVKIGKAYQKNSGRMYTGKVGSAESLLIPQQDLVDFTVRWMSENRD